MILDQDQSEWFVYWRHNCKTDVPIFLFLCLQKFAIFVPVVQSFDALGLSRFA